MLTEDVGRHSCPREQVDRGTTRSMVEVDHGPDDRPRRQGGVDRRRVSRRERHDAGGRERIDEAATRCTVARHDDDRRRRSRRDCSLDECSCLGRPPCQMRFMRLIPEHARRSRDEPVGIQSSHQPTRLQRRDTALFEHPGGVPDRCAKQLQGPSTLLPIRKLQLGAERSLESDRRLLDRLDRRAVERVAAFGERSRHVAGKRGHEGRVQPMCLWDHAEEHMRPAALSRGYHRLVRPSTIPRGNPMKKLILLIAAVAFVAVGCRAEVNVLLDINEDGAGAATFEFGLDEEFLGMIESMGGSAEDVFADLDIAGDGGEVVERTEGDMTYTGVKKDFADITEITSDLEGSTGEDAPFQDFTFVMDEKQAELTATVSTPQQDLGDMGLDPSMITGDIFSASFILAMPGTVKEHNADEVLADGRLRWELPLLGGTKDIHARSELGGGSLWWLWIILGVVLIVGAIAVIAAILLGRRQSKHAVEDAASQYPQSAVASLDATEPEAVDEVDAKDDGPGEASDEGDEGSEASEIAEDGEPSEAGDEADDAEEAGEEQN